MNGPKTICFCAFGQNPCDHFGAKAAVPGRPDQTPRQPKTTPKTTKKLNTHEHQMLKKIKKHWEKTKKHDEKLQKHHKNQKKLGKTKKNKKTKKTIIRDTSVGLLSWPSRTSVPDYGFFVFLGFLGFS